MIDLNIFFAASLTLCLVSSLMVEVFLRRAYIIVTAKDRFTVLGV